MKSVKKEYLLDQLSLFVSSKSGLVLETLFREEQVLKCPTAVCYGLNKREDFGIGADTDFSTAMIKALAEILERYTLSAYPEKHRSVLYGKTCRELESLGYSCFYPDHALYEEYVYERHSSYCKKIEPDTQTDWSPVRKFSDDSALWMPASLAHNLDKARPNILKKPSSNGMSCSFFDSAAEDSVLELIERDAFLYMWLAKSPGEEIIFDKISDKSLKAVLKIIGGKAKQIKTVFKLTDTKTPCVFVLFRGEKSQGEPAFLITAKADPDIERACRRALLEFTHIYNMFFIHKSFYEFKIKEMFSKTPLRLNDFLDHYLFYLLYENFSKCEFLFKTKGSRRLSQFTRNRDKEKTAFLKEALKDKRVFIADVTPAELARTDVSVVRAVSPDLLDLDYSDNLRFSSQIKRKRIETIGKALGEKTGCLNEDPHCFP